MACARLSLLSLTISAAIGDIRPGFQRTLASTNG
jgi:hypothetical protein